MIKLKNILKENMRRFGTKNLNETNLQDLENKLGFDSGANRDPKTGNIQANPNNFQLVINSAEYDKNIGGMVYVTYQGGSAADKSDFQDMISDIKQAIESENDPTGAYDQTRLVSDIKFDCELKVGSDKIDFTVTFDEDGDIQNVEIQDDTLARNHGINDQVIYDYIF
jgi:hypothetical protein